MFYELGARYMTLTYNCNLPWATGHLIGMFLKSNRYSLMTETITKTDRLANASLYGGLNEFGRKVVAEMNRFGMICII
jgi:microsomal dipeptidase-like Zn-dependent dipeptidase